MEFENLRYVQRAAAARITVHRPEKLNALNRRTVEELGEALARAVADDAVRVIVVAGAGERAFVAGADIAEMSALAPSAAEEFSRFLQATFLRLERSPKPVLAAIQGFALGGGCELALACHLRIASTAARFGQPEVGLGLIPGAGGTQRLPRVVGRARALELILSGRTLDAEEALRIGLVHRVVPAEALQAAVDETAEQLAARSPLALRAALQAVLGGADAALDEALALEAALFGLGFASEDMREGTRAFLEKRPPVFRGR